MTALVLAASLAVGSSVPARGQSRPPSTAGRILITAGFAHSAEEWRISTDSGQEDALFSPAGGNPGGCITGIDEALGETWYFRAPAPVLQQLPAAEHGTIRFSLKQSTDVDGGFLDDDVVIVGTAGRIGYRFGPRSAPGTRWKDFAVALTASAGWTWNWRGTATQAQIRSVLQQPLILEIRGEFYTGEDEGSLDNFTLTAAPEPSGG